jgi:hypothetical protein
MLSNVTIEYLTIIQLMIVVNYYLSKTNAKLACGVFFLIVLPFSVSIILTGQLISHDTIRYYLPYYNEDTWRTFEPGYYLLNEVFRTLSFSDLGFITFVFISAYVFFVFILHKILNRIELTLFCYFLLFSTLSFNFISVGLFRQFIALAVLVLSIYYFTKGKEKKGFAWILVASTIHFSFIIFLFYYFIQKLNERRKIILLILSLIFAVISPSIVNALVSLLPSQSDNLFLKSVIRVLGYSNKNVVHDNYLIKYLITFISLFMINLFFYRYKSLLTDNYRERFIVVTNYAITAFFFASITFFSSEASIRILYNANVINCILLSFIISGSIFKNREIVIILIVCFMFVYSYFTHLWITDFVNRYI